MTPPREQDRSIPAIFMACAGIAVQVLAEYAKDAGTVAGVAASKWLGPIGTVAGAVAGLGANQLSNWLENRKETRQAFRTLLTNEDIALSQAQCLKARLLIMAEELRSRKGELQAYAPQVKKMAVGAPKWWITLLADEKWSALDHLKDTEMIEYLTPYLATGSSGISDQALWLKVIKTANARVNGDTRIEDPGLLREIATTLAQNFKHDWIEAVKTDLKTGGKAYAAVSLRYLAEILTSIKEHGHLSKTDLAIRKELPAFAAQLKNAREELLKLTDLPEHLRQLVQGSEQRLELLIRQEGDTTRRSLTALERRIALVVVSTATIVVAVIMVAGRSAPTFDAHLRLDQQREKLALNDYPELTRTAVLTVTWSGTKRTFPVGTDPNMDLDNLAHDLLGKSVHLELTDTYWRVASDSTQLIQGDVVIPVQPTDTLALVRGKVIDPSGKGLPFKTVLVDGVTPITTDSHGDFSARMPWKQQRIRYQLYIKDAPRKPPTNYEPESIPAKIIIPK